MKILAKRRINMTMLRSLAFRGIPSEVPLLRPLVWRVLLGHLPKETARWEQAMREARTNYEDWKKDLIVEPYLIDGSFRQIRRDEGDVGCCLGSEPVREE